jgi:NAD(P)-dependent dehydrogenase (short-subunit alcohol dehydrogenase family)
VGLLDGRRVVVVGASAGIGRACAIEAVKTGGKVLMVARRAEKLTEVIAEAGGGIACAADLSKEGDTAKIAAAARAELGEIDLLLNCAAVSPLKRFMDTTFEDWERTLATNLIGAHQLVRDLKPLMSDCGIVAMMSSEIVGRWRSGLGVYGASKAAFEAMVEQWRVEYPGLRYSTIQIGSTVPTEFGVGFDETLLTELFSEWASRGLAEASFMQVDDVGRYLVDVFAVQLPFPGVCMEHLVVRTPSGSTTDTSLMEGTAVEAKQLAEG